MTDLFTDFLVKLDARYERHETRMNAINEEHSRRNAAIIARLDLELDALYEHLGKPRSGAEQPE
jgi:hypothetical protein